MISELLLIALFMGSQDAVVVSQRMTACLGGHEGEYRLVLVADEYRDAHVSVPVADVEALRTLVLASRGGPLEVPGPGENTIEKLFGREGPRDPDPLLRSFGITSKSYAAHRLDVFRSATSPRWQRGLDESSALPVAANSILAWNNVRHRLATWILYGLVQSTTKLYLDVQLPGDPPIRIETTGQGKGGLPLRLQVGDEKWHSADLAISAPLARLLHPGSGHRRFVEGIETWPDDLWEDPWLWSFLVDDLEGALSLAAVEAVTGFDALEDSWSVVDWHRAPQPSWIEVERKAPGSFQRVRWSLGPAKSWARLLPGLRVAERCLARGAWMTRWVDKRKGRYLKVEIVTSGTDSLDDHAASARDVWRRADLPGEPELAVLFMIKLPGAARPITLGMGWMANGVPETLVPWSYPGGPLGLSVGPKEGKGNRLLLVADDGTITRRY